MKTYVYLWQYLAELFFELEIFLDKRCTENPNTYFKFSNFFPKIEPFMR
jgi:hypothetical protein